MPDMVRSLTLYPSVVTICLFDYNQKSGGPDQVSLKFALPNLQRFIFQYSWQRFIFANSSAKLPQEVSFHCVNPGGVGSDIWRGFPGWQQKVGYTVNAANSQTTCFETCWSLASNLQELGDRLGLGLASFIAMFRRLPVRLWPCQIFSTILITPATAASSLSL